MSVFSVLFCLVPHFHHSFVNLIVFFLIMDRKPGGGAGRGGRAPPPPKPLKDRIRSFWINEGPSILVMALFFGAVGAVFIERYLYYLNDRPDVFSLLGHGVCIARSCGAALKLLGSVILITMMRNLLSWLRETWVGTYLPIFDKHIQWHKGIAWMIAIFATAHSMAHFVNFLRLAKAPLNTLVAINVVPVGSTVDDIPGPWELAFASLPGLTGHIILLAMVIMYTTAISSVRRPQFELFWYSHHLFLVFFFCLCIHGVQQILEPPTFWQWWAGPALLYLIERVLRVVRGSQDTIILQAIQHPSRVLELRMKKTRFDYKPGQYVFLNCPYIAKSEWHPFTISSSPDEDFLSVHIRAAGDWTGALMNLMNPSKKLGVCQENLVHAPNGRPIIQIDGPFGAASEDVFQFEIVLLWAAGIGVTPMASVLKFIRYKVESDPEHCPVKRVHFYWMNRDTSSFEWFLDLLATLEKRCPFLEINLFFTGQITEAEEIRNIIYAENEGLDAITGLSSRTTFGRPNMDKIFADLATKYKGHRIGCFFCGPPVLSNLLYDKCVKYTDPNTGTKFIYHKENF
jgi:predicted ferric reductase